MLDFIKIMISKLTVIAFFILLSIFMGYSTYSLTLQLVGG